VRHWVPGRKCTLQAIADHAEAAAYADVRMRAAAGQQIVLPCHLPPLASGLLARVRLVAERARGASGARRLVELRQLRGMLRACRDEGVHYRLSRW
jgi:hypothetical protein